MRCISTHEISLSLLSTLMTAMNPTVFLTTLVAFNEKYSSWLMTAISFLTNENLESGNLVSVLALLVGVNALSLFGFLQRKAQACFKCAHSLRLSCSAVWGQCFSRNYQKIEHSKKKCPVGLVWASAHIEKTEQRWMAVLLPLNRHSCVANAEKAKATFTLTGVSLKNFHARNIIQTETILGGRSPALHV